MEQTNKRNTLALISIMLGAFISLLDTTIVNVALPDITTALHATSETIEWVISGYALAFGLVLILAGRLGDKFGRKNIYIIGITLFLIMSVTAGFADSENSLIISRVIQGLLCRIIFPANQRHNYGYVFWEKPWENLRNSWLCYWCRNCHRTSYRRTFN